MNIVITGGAGFIGSHIVDALQEEGHNITVIDNLSSGKRENIPNTRLLEIDILSYDEINKALKEIKPDIIYHLAAQINVRTSVEKPLFDAETNILATINILEQAKDIGVKKIIFASTGGAIYGEQDYFPADEQHIERPLSPYGIGKLASEKYMYYYHKNFDLPYIALRFANVYGPRQDPHGEAGVVAIFTQKMLKGEQPIINGDGLQTRDYVYVKDVAKANVAALTSNFVGAINIGTGIETNVNELFHKIKSLIGANVIEKHGPPKKGEQKRSVLNWQRAKEILNWQPQYSLDEGLKETVEWFKKHS